MNNIPLYKIVIDEDETVGVDLISTVKDPAIGVNYLAFDKEEELQERLKFKKVDEMKLAGPFLIPDLVIPRYKEDFGYYNIVFDKESIKKIVFKFNKNPKASPINFEHSKKMVEAFIFEQWIVSGENDKSKDFGYDLPEGTWFGVVQILDEKFWNEQVKTEEVKGFSVEGNFGLELIKMNKQFNFSVKKKTFNFNAISLASMFPPVHPNCLCRIESGNGETVGVWIYNPSRSSGNKTAKGNESPCPICIEAKNKFNRLPKSVRRKI